MDDYDPERDRDGGYVPWEAVRLDYEAGLLTRNGIAHRYRLRRGQLEGRARSSKWLRPGSAEDIDRRILIARVQGLLERQMDILEADMDNGTPAESKVLSDLVRDLDKLITIERAEGHHTSPGRNRGEISDLRQKLEARIDAITKGRA
jgi:hypothetical protein